MRVLFVVHQFMPEFASGTEQVTLNLAKSAQRDGHEVAVLTASLSAAAWPHVDTVGLRFAMIDGVPVYGAPAERLAPVSALGFRPDHEFAAVLERWLREAPAFDVVHFVHTMRLSGAVDIVRRLGIPYILTLTDFFLPCYRINLLRRSGEFCWTGPEGGRACEKHCRTEEIDGRMLRDRFARLREVLHSAEAVVACSEFVARAFKRSYPDLNIRVIPHGVDLLRFAPRSRHADPEQLVFGYIGTITAAKGVRPLIAAFQAAAPKNACLRIVGPAYDRPYTESIKRELGTNPNVTLLPPASGRDVPEVLRGFDVLCLPSIVPETFSLSLHEGFAAGLPCLVSDLGHPADIVAQLGCGEVLPAGDVGAWSRALTRICNEPEALHRSMESIPLPWRLEEEGFMYAQLYRAAAANVTA
jgi:glycosyltransferase involved in cell wall biosynthesis